MSRLKWILCRAGGTNSHSFLALTSQLTNAKLKEETLQRYKFTDIVLGLTFDKSSQADHFVSFISFTHYWLHNTKIKSTERPTIQKKKFGEQSHFPFLAAIGPPKILYFVSYIYLFYRLEKVFASGWSQKQNLMQGWCHKSAPYFPITTIIFWKTLLQFWCQKSRPGKSLIQMIRSWEFDGVSLLTLFITCK